jgi:hypothetical protein
METDFTNSNLFYISTETGIVEPSIKLTLDHYQIRGAALIHTWCDNRSAIKMAPFDIDANGIQSETEFVNIIESQLNDNGFGCKSIIGAFVEVWTVYTGFNTQAKQFAKDMFVIKPGESLSEKEKDFLEAVFYTD